MVLKAKDSDFKLQRDITGEDPLRLIGMISADLAAEAPIAFKRDLLGLIECLGRIVDVSILSPRLRYPTPTTPLVYLCLSIGQDSALYARLDNYFKTDNYLSFDAGINFYNALIRRLSIALDAPYLSRIFLRNPSPTAGLSYVGASGNLLGAKVHFSVSQRARLAENNSICLLKARVEIEEIPDSTMAFGLLLLNTKRIKRSQRYVIDPNGKKTESRCYELSYPTASLGPFHRADVGLLIQARGKSTELSDDGKTMRLKGDFAQLTLPLSVNLCFPDIVSK